MVAKTQLAALDNNANTGHNQAQVQAGEHAGEARYKMCFPKTHKRWVVKPSQLVRRNRTIICQI